VRVLTFEVPLYTLDFCAQFFDDTSEVDTGAVAKLALQVKANL